MQPLLGFGFLRFALDSSNPPLHTLKMLAWEMKLLCCSLIFALISCGEPQETARERVEIGDTDTWQITISVSFLPGGGSYQYDCDSEGKLTELVRQSSAEHPDVKSTQIELDEAGVSEIYSAIKRLLVPAWADDYDPEDVSPNLFVSDGTMWEVRGEWGGEGFESKGWNAFPEIGNPAHATLEDASLMELFDLMGKLVKDKSLPDEADQPATAPEAEREAGDLAVIKVGMSVAELDKVISDYKCEDISGNIGVKRAYPAGFLEQHDVDTRWILIPDDSCLSIHLSRLKSEPALRIDSILKGPAGKGYPGKIEWRKLALEDVEKVSIAW